MGSPFLAVRGLIGTDILKRRPDLQVIDNPFHHGEPVVIVPAIRPDLAVFHAQKADRWGNSITPGPREDLLLARAARRVVVTAEEISATELTLREANPDTFLPAIDVDGVVHAPLGSHPCACGQRYPVDQVHLREYVRAAKDHRSFQEYLQRYVLGAEGHPGFGEKTFSSDGGSQ
jgi:glutaconate CoA-transferase, subunit A